MRYSYEFKKKCVEMYQNGEWLETPNDTSEVQFRRTIRKWVRQAEYCGIESLMNKKKYKEWTPSERYEIVAQVLAGKSYSEVSLLNGISSGQLYQWVRKYKTMGYNGLVTDNRGRPSKESRMKKKTEPTPLAESEREELIRLRAEVEYMKAENEVIKKEIALREEREAARLKAKKQQSSKNSKNKDSN